MAYYLLVRYYSNKGYILDNPHYFSSGVTSYSSVTASSSSSYKYFKTDSTRTNQTSTVIKGATTSSGTYGNVGNRYTASSTSTVCNLTDVSTFGLTRDGYHINADEAYKSSDGSKVYGQNGSSAPSAKQATISRLGGSTSANKTVAIYVNWIGNSYTVRFNASGGSGTMSDQTGFVFGTGKALSSNTFTRTGYTFAGWSKSSGGITQVFYVSDVGPYDPISIGTDGTYLYFKQNSTQYYRVTVDDSNSYTDIGSTAPSGVSTWIGEGTHFTFQGNEYYWSHTYNDNTGIDRCYIYRVDSAQTVDYTDGASMSDAGGTIPVEAGTTVVNLYAVWTPYTCTNIYYSANGGTGTPSSPTSATYNDSFTMSSIIPTRLGYKFDGWAMGLGPSAQNAQTVAQLEANNHSVFLQPSQTIIWPYYAPYIAFCAVWTPVVYVKQNGTWKEVIPQIKASGTWKTPIFAYIKVNNVWKKIWSSGNFYAVDTTEHDPFFTIQETGEVTINYEFTISGTTNYTNTDTLHGLYLRYGTSHYKLQTLTFTPSGGTFTTTVSGSYTTTLSEGNNYLYIYRNGTTIVNSWHITGTVSIT